MDPRHLPIDERLKTGACVYCHGEANTRDHVPSKVLLDEPYPPQLPTVDACEACNDGFSADEQYLSCFIECALCGTTQTGDLQRPKVKRILDERAKLREEIRGAMTRNGATLLWKPEIERVRHVIRKLATGHAAHELFPQNERPDRIEFSPLLSLSKQHRDDFETGPWGGIAGWPEIGSRAFMRACGAKVDEFVQVGGWVVVQSGRYRYAVNEAGGVLVRIVLSEYLVCTAAWG